MARHPLRRITSNRGTEAMSKIDWCFFWFILAGSIAGVIVGLVDKDGALAMYAAMAAVQTLHIAVAKSSARPTEREHQP